MKTEEGKQKKKTQTQNDGGDCANDDNLTHSQHDE
jgi:hypothetical protein